MKIRLVYLVIIFTLILTHPEFAFAGKKRLKRQVIQNNTGGPVNDLKLKLTRGNQFEGKPRLWYSGNSADGVLKNANRTAEWAPSTFGIIPKDKKAVIDFSAKTGILGKSSRWTVDGNEVGGETGVKVPGKPMELMFNLSNKKASAYFTNQGTTTITYGNIRLFKNNSMSNFNISDFMEPTGTQVSAPNTVQLDPNESMILSFGTVDVNNTYQLCLANVSEDIDPNNLFEVVSAAAWIPETIPTVSEWGLIIMALLLLAVGTVMIRRRLKPMPI